MKRILLFAILWGIIAAIGTASAAVGTTTVAKWKDNKRAIFTMIFEKTIPPHPLPPFPCLCTKPRSLLSSSSH